jgi:hypothetical protein
MKTSTLPILVSMYVLYVMSDVCMAYVLSVKVMYIAL